MDWFRGSKNDPKNPQRHTRITLDREHIDLWPASDRTRTRFLDFSDFWSSWASGQSFKRWQHQNPKFYPVIKSTLYDSFTLCVFLLQCARWAVFWGNCCPYHRDFHCCCHRLHPSRSTLELSVLSWLAFSSKYTFLQGFHQAPVSSVFFLFRWAGPAHTRRPVWIFIFSYYFHKVEKI